MKTNFNLEPVVPFTTTIFINEDTEYVCDACAVEKPGPFTKMSYKVEIDLHLVWCCFCQKEIPDPA